MVAAGINPSSSAVAAFALGSWVVACLVLAVVGCTTTFSAVHLVLGSVYSAESLGYILVFAGC